MKKVTIFNKPLKSLGNIKIRGSPARTFSRPIRTRIRCKLVFIGKTKGNQWFSSVVFEKNHEFYENFDEKVKKCPKRIYIYVLGALAGALGDQKSLKFAKNS